LSVILTVVDDCRGDKKKARNAGLFEIS